MPSIYQPKTAVILAAGLGLRLRSVIGEVPKGLLEIQGSGLLERSIQLLSSYGITKFFVVTGFQHQMLESRLQEQLRGTHLSFVHNQQYASSGSMESLATMKGQVQEDFLLLESDLIYERRALELLLEAGQPDTVLTSGQTNSKDEVWIYGEPRSGKGESLELGRIRYINKQPSSEFALRGELVGISWLSADLFVAMCDYHAANKPRTLQYHYEENISDLSAERQISYLKISDLIWAEIDMESHYRRVLNEVYPRIQARENTEISAEPAYS
jgi:choline kinase